MPRVKKGAAKTRKHRKVMKTVRGFRGTGSRRYHVAKEALLRAGRYATYGRKIRKRDFRKLWIARINAACRMRGITYSRFMEGMAKAEIKLNRKILSEMAIADPAAFDRLVEQVTGKPIAAATA